MTSFLFMEKEHILYPVTDDVLNNVAFVIHIPYNKAKQMVNGEFKTPSSSYHQNTVIFNGPILFTTSVSQKSTQIHMMFQTKEIFTKIPPVIHLFEYDLFFFDEYKMRESVLFLARQQPENLLQFEDTIFQIAKKVAREKNQQTRLDILTTGLNTK